METVERSGVAPEYGLAAALSACHFEVIPLKDTFERVAVLPAGSIVTVTASAARGIEPTMELAVRLSAAGYVAVPHLAARSIRDRAHLLDLVVRLEEADVHRAFVVGGDAGEPGEFPDGLSMLRAMDEMGHHFQEVGVPAYPQGHPLIDTEVLRQALLAKQGIASYMTTQLCFDPGAIDGWLRAARADGVRLPLVLGLPGPADMARVVRIAARIGVAASSRYLRKNRGLLGAVLRRKAFRPDRLLHQLRGTIEDSVAGVRGLHVYTFNQVREAAEWRLREQAHAASR
ncbi:MAG TPA: methylenetetrahydrofolate reductase [Actinomycetota bacterium]